MKNNKTIGGFRNCSYRVGFSKNDYAVARMKRVVKGGKWEQLSDGLYIKYTLLTEY